MQRYQRLWEIDFLQYLHNYSHSQIARRKKDGSHGLLRRLSQFGIELKFICIRQFGRNDVDLKYVEESRFLIIVHIR